MCGRIILLLLLGTSYLVEGNKTVLHPGLNVTLENNDLQFFQRIQQLNLDWDDIVGTYRNVSAEVQTEMCRNKCKTAIAFWVLQSLKPCDVIAKVDCPKGLLCCKYYPSDQQFLDEMSNEPQKPKDAEDLVVGEKVPAITPEVDDSQHWTDPEPVLDPIPDEEPHKFEETELITS